LDHAVSWTPRVITNDAVEISATGLADEITDLAGEMEGVSTLVTIALGDGHSQIRILGEQMSLYSLMGIFEAAKFEMLSELIEVGE
jgi:hypothetical protein